MRARRQDQGIDSNMYREVVGGDEQSDARADTRV